MGLYMPTAAGEYDPFKEAIEAFLTNNFVAYSDTKKAQEIATAQDQAYRTGLAVALTALLNERRLSFFESLASEHEVMPALHVSFVSQRLRDLKIAWKQTDYSYKLVDFWANECQSFLLDLLATEDVMELETERHRKAVLAGKEDPRSSDENWLAEEADRQAAEAKALREAADEAERAASFLASKRSATTD